MPFDPERHHRQSIRLKGYDYRQPGAYFITICTVNRECLFGSIQEGQWMANPCGEIVARVWQALPNQFDQIIADTFVVMPNHFHGILILHGAVASQKPLGNLIGAFKTMTTKQINQLDNVAGRVIWQRNFYEHIIRHDQEQAAIQAYIANNPVNWIADELYQS